MISPPASADERATTARRREPALALAVCAVVLVGVPVGWHAGPPPVDAGSLAPLDIPVAAPAPPPRPHPRPDPWQVRAHTDADAPEPPRRPEVATRSARLADVSAAAVVPPTRLEIPALGVDAPVTPVGVDDDGLMEIPDDVATIGWYRHGPAPGAPAGSAVLTAHVDSRTQGRGVLFSLREVPIGAPVTVTSDGGQRLPYEVVARRSHPKAGLPERLFRRSGEPVLTLITCGGAFDPATRTYAENVVVYAAPVAS